MISWISLIPIIISVTSFAFPDIIFVCCKSLPPASVRRFQSFNHPHKNVLKLYLVLKFLDYQAGIDTTKSQGVGQGIVDIHRNTLAHRVIQIAALACLF